MTTMGLPRQWWKALLPGQTAGGEAPANEQRRINKARSLADCAIGMCEPFGRTEQCASFIRDSAMLCLAWGGTTRVASIVVR